MSKKASNHKKQADLIKTQIQLSKVKIRIIEINKPKLSDILKTSNKD